MHKIALVGFGMLLVALASAHAAQARHEGRSRYAPPPPVYEGRSVYVAPPVTMAPYVERERGCFVTTDPTRGIRHWRPSC